MVGGRFETSEQKVRNEEQAGCGLGGRIVTIFEIGGGGGLQEPNDLKQLPESICLPIDPCIHLSIHIPLCMCIYIYTYAYIHTHTQIVDSPLSRDFEAWLA